MKMIKMKYRDFEFEVNPSEVSMKLTKNISKTDFANHGEKCEEINKKGAIISGKQLRLSEETQPIRGGFILKDKNVEVNCTFETLVRLQKAETAGAVVKKLFA